MQKRHKSKDLFFSYPAWLIADWCGVSEHTARLYKNGVRRPSRQALMLFELHSRGCVLGPEWDGWSVRKDRIFNPEGGEFTQGQLRAYEIIWQIAQNNTHENPTARNVLYGAKRIYDWRQMKARRERQEGALPSASRRNESGTDG